MVNRQILKKEHIITDRLRLGPYRKEDRERLKEMMQNPKITVRLWYLIIVKKYSFMR